MAILGWSSLSMRIFHHNVTYVFYVVSSFDVNGNLGILNFG